VLAKARRNPLTGSIVVADNVLKPASADEGSEAAFKREVIAACHEALADYRGPGVIRFLPSLEVPASGKLARISV